MNLPHVREIRGQGLPGGMEFEDAVHEVYPARMLSVKAMKTAMVSQ